MLPIWPTRTLVQITSFLFALTTTLAPLADSLDHFCELKLLSTSSHRLEDTILLEPEECLPVENYWPGNSNLLDTDGNCLELWSNADCTGNLLYYVSSSNRDLDEDVSWANFRAKSVKLCDRTKQPTHRVVRRGLMENTTEYYFWFHLSKMRGRLEVFLEEFRKGGGHPDWETILRGRNWQGPRSKIYLKALHKVINIFKTYSDMDMKWSRYTTEELDKVRKLAADVVKLREIKALKFPNTDPQSKVHTKIVGIWKNITITLDRAYEIKAKYDVSVKQKKSTSTTGLPGTAEKKVESSTKTTVPDTKSTTSTSPASTSKQNEFSARITAVDMTSTTSSKPTSTSEKNLSADDSFVKIVD